MNTLRKLTEELRLSSKNLATHQRELESQYEELVRIKGLLIAILKSPIENIKQTIGTSRELLNHKIKRQEGMEGRTGIERRSGVDRRAKER